MQLDVRGAAAVMNVSESTIRRWIEERQLPATGVEGVYRFGRAELLEWATAHHIDLRPEVFDKQMAEASERLLCDALEAGAVLHDVPAADAETALRAVFERIEPPGGIDPQLLLELFLSREKLGSTAVGDGIAIPHARHPVVLPLDQPRLYLCFLSKPIDFGGPRGAGVHTLFVLLSPTVKTHLRLIARVAALLHDKRFRQALAARKPAGEILLEARRAEESIEHDGQARHSER